VRRATAIATGLAVICCIGCARPVSTNPSRYRLMESGDHWDVSGHDHVFDDLRPRYPEFFEVILDPTKARVPNLIVLRDDLERSPVSRRNFDALNSIAIAYYETNYRAEAGRGDGLVYLALSQRSAKLLAVPWRAYGEIDEPALRSAILDFFEDAGSGQKLNSESTAPRLVRIVGSLQKKEQDPARLARIQALTRALEAKAAEIMSADDAP
jgi:hypothetical protein